jgi:hypothetical protein
MNDQQHETILESRREGGHVITTKNKNKEEEEEEEEDQEAEEDRYFFATMDELLYAIPICMCFVLSFGVCS